MTPEELSHYREHGYVVQRGLFSNDELQVWLDRLVALIRGEVPKSDGMLIMRDVMIAKGAVEAVSPEAAIAKIQDFDRDPVLRTYTDHPRLLAEIAALTGENIVCSASSRMRSPRQSGWESGVALEVVWISVDLLVVLLFRDVVCV